MFYRNKELWAKLEVTYGTDPTPVGTDAILTQNCSIVRYSGNKVSRGLDQAYLGAESQINTNPGVQLTFEVEIAGSGSAGTAPAYDALLRAIGFVQSDSSPTGTSKIYNLTSGSPEHSSVTFWFEQDGMLQKVNGARGTAVLTFPRDAMPKLQFTFMGQYTRPTAQNLTGTDVSDFIAPVPVTNTNTPTFTMGGSPLTSLVSESVTFDIGNTVVHRNLINNNEIYITDRSVSMQAVVEAVLPSTKDWFADAIESHLGTINTQTLQLIHGTTSGNIVQVDCPAVQIVEAPESDSDGILTQTFTGLCLPSSGNDELTLTIY